MRYLISGHPRTRSAWFCALLNAHGSRCYHDALLNEIDLDGDFGISDPGIACLRPDDGIRLTVGKPRICILRDHWRDAFERWVGTALADEEVEKMEANVRQFEHTLGTVAIDHRQLEDNQTVGDLVNLCTGMAPDPELIRIFQQLQIEQHRAKAHAAFASGQVIGIIGEST